MVNLSPVPAPPEQEEPTQPVEEVPTIPSSSAAHSIERSPCTVDGVIPLGLRACVSYWGVISGPCARASKAGGHARQCRRSVTYVKRYARASSS